MSFSPGSSVQESQSTETRLPPKRKNSILEFTLVHTALFDEGDKEEDQTYKLSLLNAKQKVIAELKCDTLQPLKELVNQISDTL